jgi:hypothetical protein
VLDDYLRNAEDARSQATRDSQYDWFLSTALTRLSPKGVAVAVCTRWHLDDLAGRLLREMEAGHGESWTVLRLPAICEDADDPLGRPLGVALWPDRYSLERLLEIKSAQGSYWFDCQYQGRPTDDAAGIFKRSLFRWFMPSEDAGTTSSSSPTAQSS